MEDSNSPYSPNDNFSSSNDALRQMYRITAAYDRSFEGNSLISLSLVAATSMLSPDF